MKASLLALVNPPPPGFRYCEQLTARDVRRGVFALYATTCDKAEAALSPWLGKINGILIGRGDQLLLHRAASGLFHLTLREQDESHLADWLPSLTLVLQETMDRDEQVRVLSIEVERLTADRAQAATEFSSFRASLLSENHERRRIEEALRASEMRFRTIFNSVNDAIFIQHAQTGEIQEVNTRACEMYGYSEDELRRLRVADLSAPTPDFNEHRALERIHGAAQQPQIFTWQARHKSGRLFWVEVNMRAALILGVESVLVAVRDITERKEAEETRRNLEAQLLQTQKLESLGVLAGGIAHDFNNLLLAILGNVDLAGSDMSPTAPGRNYLNEIEYAAHRAADLCRQMLAYAGKGSFVVQPINLSDLIREMDHLLNISISKKAEVHYRLSNALPAVQADATQLRQIIMNLVINASESLEEREGIIAVSTGARFVTRIELTSAYLGADLPEGRYVFLEVADTGCGMKPDLIARIFDPFFSTKFTGRGLGLATVYGLVRSHQGAIQLESEPGRGTTFRVLLPALHQDTAPQEKTPTHDGSWHGQGTVLVVDDEEAVRSLSQHALERMGFSVLLAEDGRQAVNLFQTRIASAEAHQQAPIACVLLDLTMPHMDGVETFHALRKLQKDLRVMVTSGYSEQHVLPRFVHEERIGFLQKPYRTSELRAALQKLLEQP
jgi:PAS domain S-box-containing protein